MSWVGISRRFFGQPISFRNVPNEIELCNAVEMPGNIWGALPSIMNQKFDAATLRLAELLAG